MASLDLFGPTQGAGGVTIRPTEIRAFTATDTFFKDCSSPDLDDGTEFDAAWFNQVLGVLRGLARGNGQTAGAADVVTQDNANDLILLTAVQQLIQRGQPKYSRDTGTANNVVVALSPAAVEYKEGMVVVAKIAFTSTGPSTLKCNGLAPIPIKHSDGSDVAINDMPAGSLQAFAFDGTNFQIVWSQRQPGALPILTAPADWYVDSAIGSDTAYDGTSPTVNGTHGPFATIQAGVAQTQKFNMNGNNQTVHVANGSYTGQVVLPPTNGAGTVIILGNIANPAACTLTSNVQWGNGFFQTGGNYQVQGFTIGVSGANTFDGVAVNTGKMLLGNCAFNACTRYHISCAQAGLLLLLPGTITINSGANAAAHICSSLAGTIGFLTAPPQPPTLNILGSVTFSTGFIVSNFAGTTQMLYAAVNGFANVHGTKYSVYMNGLLSSFSSGPNYFPGDQPGTLATGGEYS